MDIKIENMTCGGCANSVTKAIRSVDPTARVEANLATRLVKVETTAALTDLQQILEEVGYPASAN